MQNVIFKTSALVIVIAVIAGVLAWKTAVTAQTAQPLKIPRWEYCYMTAPYSTVDGWKVQVSKGGEPEIRDSDKTGVSALNKLGLEGWELVGLGDSSLPFTFVLKRPKS